MFVRLAQREFILPPFLKSVSDNPHLLSMSFCPKAGFIRKVLENSRLAAHGLTNAAAGSKL